MKNCVYCNTQLIYDERICCDGCRYAAVEAMLLELD
jgi:predicted nucleic acid-binding Zn ribbon protein